MIGWKCTGGGQMCDLEFYSFDVDKFFGDYESKKKALKFLKAKRDAVLVSSSMNTDEPKVTGGLPVSSVETKVERREKIEEEIQRIERYFALCDKIVNDMDGESQIIIVEYFIKRHKSRADVDFLADKLFCSPSTFYRKVKNTRGLVREYMYEMSRGE